MLFCDLLLIDYYAHASSEVREPISTSLCNRVTQLLVKKRRSGGAFGNTEIYLTGPIFKLRPRALETNAISLDQLADMFCVSYFNIYSVLKEYQLL